MLSLMTAKEIRPEVETRDLDPGFLSLVAAFVRFTGEFRSSRKGQ
ncbi:hypothetical protein [Methylobacterium gnaphalii]|nr:hypothetical protein [Methylobacterium gnaphalii]GJD71572.1 hypothetical protein MMMDOFMJ_4534 [Methylobacterium gnaphalii]